MNSGTGTEPEREQRPRRFTQPVKVAEVRGCRPDGRPDPGGRRGDDDLQPHRKQFRPVRAELDAEVGREIGLAEAEPDARGEAATSATDCSPRAVSTIGRQAASLTDSVDRLQYVICARSEVTRADPDTTVITAADIFPDVTGAR